MASYQVPTETRLPMPHQEPPRRSIRTLKDLVVRIVWLAVGLALVFIPQLPMSAVLIMKKEHHPASTPVFIALLVLMIVLYGGAIWAVRRLIRQYTSQPLVRRWEARDWLYLGVGYLVMLGTKLLLIPFYTGTSGEKMTQNDAAIQALLKNGNQMVIMIVLMTVFAAPIIEEMVFRGYVMTAFYTKNPIWPILISGILFGAVHRNDNLAGTLIYVVLGMILAYVYRRTGNMGVNIGLHFLNNAPMLLIGLQMLK
ncbi:CPBP family intramembrane glutamic endopeptidase [Schleiferilactobacillus shenzhenensis]|uniref:CAAX prenyl protease 2/Lysostaphin resistance protein A-like domain-containing protein n=1 Tax=Schleiferilactobacillus shenzhenensis LY-73 TaxID=1231336 RepID=U4TVJ6_9LACO|nr:type II CAAX endopeptidase family protein [Schleiferilactobacillus shenzhenensis]ERL65412.1 hypothetical protein L248_2811 [Schleiferilactobacillus shenzhenensis LY-73]